MRSLGPFSASRATVVRANLADRSEEAQRRMEADPESGGIATIHHLAMFDMQCSNPPSQLGLKAMKDICLVDLWVRHPKHVTRLTCRRCNTASVNLVHFAIMYWRPAGNTRQRNMEANKHSTTFEIKRGEAKLSKVFHVNFCHDASCKESSSPTTSSLANATTC